jgi:hypothetical protein
MIITGGGGYNPSSTARMWALEIGTLIETELPINNPQSWIDYCREFYQLKPQINFVDIPNKFQPEKILELYSINPERIDSFNKKYEETFYDEVSKYFKIPSP